MLKQVAKEVIGFIFRFSGTPYIIRKVFLKNKVTIVVYHNPNPEVFKKHIEYLSRQYNFISLSRLVSAIHTRNWADIPEKALVLTFDDGHKDNYKLLEIFRTYNINLTIYLCSHIINTNRSFWWKTGYSNHEKLKKIPHDMMLKSLREEVDYWPEKNYLERQSLNKSEIIEMLPYMDFGSHTKFHPILINCSKEKCKYEIANSKKYLEQLLGKTIEDFCFPNGDYSSREIVYIKESGYRSARTLDVGWNDINTDPYKLKVMEVQDNASINVLCAQVSGFFGYLRYLRYRSLKRTRLPFIREKDL